MEQFEFKGTQGKWFSCCLNAKPHYCYADDGEKVICGFYKKQEMCDDLSDEEIRANALLISKAPEMLEMLKIILEGKCDIPEWKKEMAKKLLKEATEL